MKLQDIPTLNACLNGISTLLLIAGFVFIRKGDKQSHQKCMIAAVCTSTLFLAGYLYYHFNTEAVTRFTDPQWFRPIYLAILISHTILAVAVPPLVIATLILAIKGNFSSHKKIARWTWPIWMYVSITGVLIYLLLYQLFPQS